MWRIWVKKGFTKRVTGSVCREEAPAGEYRQNWQTDGEVQETGGGALVERGRRTDSLPGGLTLSGGGGSEERPS